MEANLVATASSLGGGGALSSMCFPKPENQLIFKGYFKMEPRRSQRKKQVSNRSLPDLSVCLRLITVTFI